MKYKTKAVFVDAIQVAELIDKFKTNRNSLPNWVLDAVQVGNIVRNLYDRLIIVKALNSIQMIPSDWLVKGDGGELSSVPADVFEQGYEFVPEQNITY